MKPDSITGALLGCALVACLVVLPGAAAADVDLAVVDVHVGYDSGNWEIAVELSAQYHGSHGPVATDVNVYLDNNWAFGHPFQGDLYPVESCEDSAPACDGFCTPIIYNGQLVSGSCNDWLDLNGCACMYVIFTDPYLVSDTNQSTCMAVVDEGNTVQEADETNNSMTVSLVPIPVERHSWSAIKALYR